MLKLFVLRGVHERHRAVGEQHQPYTAEQGGGEGRGRVRPGGGIRAVPGVAPVCVFSVATAPSWTVARRDRRRPERCGRRRSRVVSRDAAPRVGRRI